MRRRGRRPSDPRERVCRGRRLRTGGGRAVDRLPPDRGRPLRLRRADRARRVRHAPRRRRLRAGLADERRRRPVPARARRRARRDRRRERRLVLPRDRAVPRARLGDRLGRRLARGRVRGADAARRLLRPSRLRLPGPAAVRGLARRRRDDPAALARRRGGRRSRSPRSGRRCCSGRGSAAPSRRSPRTSTPPCSSDCRSRAWSASPSGSPARGPGLAAILAAPSGAFDVDTAARLGLYGLAAAVVVWFEPRRAFAAGVALGLVPGDGRVGALERRAPPTATFSRSRPRSCCSPGARARLREVGGMTTRRAIAEPLHDARAAWRLRATLAAAAFARGRVRAARSSASRASPTSPAASTSRAPQSGSRSRSASRDCRCSRRERSWPSAPWRRRISARPRSARPRERSRAGLPAVLIGLAFARLPRAGFAAATWIVSWLVAFALQSLGWPLGGARGTVVAGGPSPAAALRARPRAHAARSARLRGARPGAARAAARRGARPRAGRRRAAASPFVRLRTAALGVSGTFAGLAGALAVHLAGVGDPAALRPVPLVQALRRRPDRRRRSRRSAPSPAWSCSACSRWPRTRSARSSTSPPHARTRSSRRSCCSASSRSAGRASCGRGSAAAPRPGRHRARPRCRRRGLEARGLDQALRRHRRRRRHRPRRRAGANHRARRAERLWKDHGAAHARGHGGPRSGSCRRRARARPSGRFRQPPSSRPRRRSSTCSPPRRAAAAEAGSPDRCFSTPQMRAEDAAFVAWAEHVLARFGLPRDTPAGQLPVVTSAC